MPKVAYEPYESIALAAGQNSWRVLEMALDSPDGDLLGTVQWNSGTWYAESNETSYGHHSSLEEAKAALEAAIQKEPEES